MIEKIHLTSFVLFAVSYLVIAYTNAKDLKDWFMLIVLIICGGSAITMVALTLYRIWA